MRPSNSAELLNSAEKKYHHDKKLSEIVDTYPYAGDAEKVLEERMRDKFLDFISGVLVSLRF